MVRCVVLMRLLSIMTVVCRQRRARRFREPARRRRLATGSRRWATSSRSRCAAPGRATAASCIAIARSSASTRATSGSRARCASASAGASNGCPAASRGCTSTTRPSRSPRGTGRVPSAGARATRPTGPPGPRVSAWRRRRRRRSTASCTASGSCAGRTAAACTSWAGPSCRTAPSSLLDDGTPMLVAGERSWSGRARDIAAAARDRRGARRMSSPRRRRSPPCARAIRSRSTPARLRAEHVGVRSCWRSRRADGRRRDARRSWAGERSPASSPTRRAVHAHAPRSRRPGADRLSAADGGVGLRARAHRRA